MAGLVAPGLDPGAIPIVWALSFPDRDRRDKPGDDELATTNFVPVTFAMPSNSLRTGKITGNFRSFHRFITHFLPCGVNSLSGFSILQPIHCSARNREYFMPEQGMYLSKQITILCWIGRNLSAWSWPYSSRSSTSLSLHGIIDIDGRDKSGRGEAIDNASW